MAKINGIGIEFNYIMHFSLNTVSGETKRVTTKVNKGHVTQLLMECNYFVSHETSVHAF
jgi:hypothetical protein